MADAKQFEKVRDIVRADPARKVIVVSAAGKRSADDHKLTDLLYLCYAHLQYGVNCDAVFQMICDRYIAIRDECGLNVDIEAELDVLRRQMRAGISEEELVSRGEYFSAVHVASDCVPYGFRVEVFVERVIIIRARNVHAFRQSDFHIPRFVRRRNYSDRRRFSEADFVRESEDFRDAEALIMPVRKPRNDADIGLRRLCGS